MSFDVNDTINDRYVLNKSIGRGSFGEVWLATDKKIGINVAIKIYVALDSRGLDEFKNEFKSVYSLHHPNLLKADYFDNAGEQPYLVMQYCPSSAVKLIGEISEDEIWKFIHDVASGLAYLHENDIIHRDIKPDNILKDAAGHYVITDFGLSLKMRSTLRRASTRLKNNASDQAGSISYMAPELFKAEPESVKATDIWALGATIYELATGSLPFMGQGGVMQLHGAETPKLPSAFSKRLSDLMGKCLSANTWDRPTADEIASSLSLNTPKTQEAECVSRETYDNDIEALKKTIETERENHKFVVESLQNDNGSNRNSSKKLKIWMAIACIIALVAIICCFKLNNSLNISLSSLECQNQEYKWMSTAFKKAMEDTPLIVRDIEIWNEGENPGNPIISKNTSYIYHRATFIANEKYTGDSVFVKFITPKGLSRGSKSPQGYSYSQNILYSPYEMCDNESSGWGGKDKGHWQPGSYRIEYWLNNKCIGSKDFTIQE